MIQRPRISARTDTLCPYATPFRSTWEFRRVIVKEALLDRPGLGPFGDLQIAYHGFVDKPFDLRNLDRIGIVELLDRRRDPAAAAAFVAHPRDPDARFDIDDLSGLLVVGQDRRRPAEQIGRAHV